MREIAEKTKRFYAPTVTPSCSDAITDFKGELVILLSRKSREEKKAPCLRIRKTWIGCDLDRHISSTHIALLMGFPIIVRKSRALLKPRRSTTKVDSIGPFTSRVLAKETNLRVLIAMTPTPSSSATISQSTIPFKSQAMD